ncbi:MAG: EAL domain-containing protein [Acidimicrobiia bacterium]
MRPKDRLSDFERSALEHLPAGLIVCDREGRALFANALVREIAGLPESQGDFDVCELLDVDGNFDDIMTRATQAATVGRNTPIEVTGTIRYSEDINIPVVMLIKALPAVKACSVLIRVLGEEYNKALRLRLAEERLEHLVTNVPAGIISSEFGMRADYINEYAARIFASSVEDLLGFGWLDHLDEDGAYLAEDAIGQVLVDGSARIFTSSLKSREGLERRVRIKVARAGLANRDVGFVATIEDLTESDNLNRQLRVQATQDPLTMLPNREVLWSELDEVLKLNIAQAAVLFIDLDDFKYINDSLGHSAGDHLLTVIAERLRVCARASDLVVRFAADEFVVLLRHVNKRSDVEIISERILTAISEPVALEGATVIITASIGIVWPNDYPKALQPIGVETVLRDADLALLQAKCSGKNRAQSFRESLRDKSKRHIGLAAALRRAIEENNNTGEIYLHFQPIIDLETSHLKGMEALARWNSPEFGGVSPGDFIPVAEETGLITRLGELALNLAVEEIAKWRQYPGAEHLYVSVNMSATDLNDFALIDRVERALATRSLPGEALHLELTESAVMADPAEALQLISLLRALGTPISIDDFGTGYSSLAYLQRLPVDMVKIDREFISSIEESGTALVGGIAALARALDLSVIAEGVETAKQVELLRALDVPYAQGFYYSRPIPAVAMSELVRKIDRPLT